MPYINQQDDDRKKSTLVSRNITVCGKRTSVRLEPEMWRALKDISVRECCTIHEVCSLVAMRKSENTSLTAAIRVFLMLYFRAATTEDGHVRAGHGSFENMRKRAGISPVETGFHGAPAPGPSSDRNSGHGMAPAEQDMMGKKMIVDKKIAGFSESRM